MNKLLLLLPIALILGIWLSSSTADEMSNQSAISSMAGIMQQLNHYPSDKDKIILKEIIDHAPENSRQRILATSIMNLEHSVASQDAPKLTAIIADDSASQDERDLAKIILNLNHKPDSNDQKRLQSMMR